MAIPLEKQTLVYDLSLVQIEANWLLGIRNLKSQQKLFSILLILVAPKQKTICIFGIFESYLF